MTTTQPTAHAQRQSRVPRRAKSKRSAVPGGVFAALAVALAILVVTALQPSQPPPPPVAEYAPEAVQAIKQAPPEQSADAGIGDVGGANGAGGSTPTTLAGSTSTTAATPPTTSAPPSGPVIEQARVRHCIGNPPRQTEDPQSPPCVAYFDPKQDNGGVTSPGVTKNEIRITVPNTAGDRIPQLLRYFNSRYELYGRQLTLVPGGCFGGSPAGGKNLADSFAKLNIFADVGYCDVKGSEGFFFKQLARRGIVGVADKPSLSTEADLAEFHPYFWTYLPTYDKGIRHLGELSCSLNGQLASHAGPQYITAQRKFGIITATYDDAPTPDTSAIIASLKACGIDPVRTEVKQERDAGATQGASQATIQQAQAAALRLRQDNVTTVLVLLHSEVTKQIYATFSAQGYQPEIGITSYLYNDQDLFFSSLPTDQSSHTFGVSTWNRFQRVADEPWYQAMNEVDPGHVYMYAPGDYFGTNFDYRSLQVLAAGIQLAGPNLTPANFAAGLQRAKWPNPSDRSTPGKVTVAPGTHSYMEDSAVIWWDPTGGNSEYGGDGQFCYVDGGKRFRFGSYPKGAPGLFTRPCQRF